MKHKINPQVIIDNSPDVIFVISTSGEILYVNRSFSQKFGFSPEEILGKSVLEIIQNKEAFYDCLRIVKNGDICPDQEVAFKTKDGKKLKLIKRVRGIKDEKGSIRYIVVNANDITYIDVLREKLEKYAHSLEEIIEERTQELRKLKVFLENIISCIPDIIIVTDLNKNIIFANKAAEKLTDKKENLLSSVYVNNSQKRLSDILDQKNFETEGLECTFREREKEVPLYAVISPLSGTQKGYVVVLRDLSEIKKKEENLNLFKTIFENTLDAIGIVDTEGRYVNQNRSNEELLGYTLDEIKGKHFSSFLKIKNSEKAWKELKEKGKIRFLGTSVDKNGVEKHFDIVALSVKDSFGTDKYYVGIKREITDLIKREKELEKLNKQLEKRLYTDPLTELPNRIKLIEDLKNVGSPKLAILNIDDFKEINDFYGYQVGDFVLKQLGKSIKNLLPESGFQVYRLSGDEFGILALRYVQASEFEKIINNILYFVHENPVIYKDSEIHISLTAGISLENHNILNKADMALKYAKENKKPVVYYKDELQIKQLYETNILMTRKIKEALKNNKIIVHYQPIFNNKTGKAEKYESLVRMVDLDGSIVLPGKFLEIAKKARLYPEIAKRVIKTSFENFRDLNVGFTINLSVKDIQNREITELIFEYLSDKTFNSRVVFEILESEGIENYQEVSGFIKEVKNLGGKISIDDFGAGYSNFEYILKLDVDFVKIDSSLIKNVDTDIYSQIIVETIVGFTKKLGIQTIAEFVHSEDVYEAVKNLGIDYSQGFFLGKPKPFHQLFNT